MSTEVLTDEIVTPDQAATWLATNSANRRLRKDAYLLYARYMETGRWLFTGDPIVIDRDGILRQGQHRLMGCVAANVPFRTAVLRGADPGIATFLDTGVPRSLQDLFTIDGFKDAAPLAGAVRVIVAYRIGALTNALRNQRQLDRRVLEEFASANLDALDIAVQNGIRVYRSIGGSRPAWIASAFEMSTLDPAMSDDFIAGVAEGANLADGDPRLLLRNLIVNRAARRNPLRLPEVLFTCARTWNLFISGAKVGAVKGWKQGQKPVRFERLDHTPTMIDEGDFAGDAS